MENNTQSPEQSTQVAVQNAPSNSTNDMVIGVNTDVSQLSIEQRAELFQRYSEAQASTKIDDGHLNKVLTAVAMTVYQRDFIDQETGEIGLATYVSFTLDNGDSFKTASSQATPFALSVARFLGYDATTGELPYPIKFTIVPQKADTGFKYNFVFKGLAK